MLPSALSAIATNAQNAHHACHPSTFSFPEILGAEVINISADNVKNHTQVSALPGTDIGSMPYISF
jgi:hypothetical protein